jgi:hypothetical protein
MRRRALLVGFTVLGLIACNRGGLPPEKVQAWVGRPAADLVREWGTPTREVDDAGQRVLVYEEIERTKSHEFSREVSSQTRMAGQGPAAPVAPASSLGYSSYARSYLLWVDAAGKIARTQIRQP